MTLRHLQIFIAVYETQNITKAAEKLNMTQPAVTRAIKEIENYYGVSVFDRINKRIKNNPCGEELYNKAIHINSLYKDIETSLTDWDFKGTVRIGSTITIGNFIIPNLVKQIKNRNPGLKIKVRIAKQSIIEQLLASGVIDIALTEHIPQGENLIYEVFDKDKMVLILPNEHELLEKNEIKLKDLQHYSLLMRDEGSAGRTFVQEVFNTKSVPFHVDWESASTQALVKGVHHGLGLSILPYELVEKEINEGFVSAAQISDTDLTRNFWLVYHKNKFLSGSLKEIIRGLKQKQYSCKETEE